MTLSVPNQRPGDLRARACQRLISEHMTGRRDHRKPLWTLFVFQLWHRRWIERRNSHATVSHRMTSRRVRVAEVLAFVGLVAALVGALGPADRIRTTYSWPPGRCRGTPTKLWYTPCSSRHRPETLTATLPCALSPLAGAGPERYRACDCAIPRTSGGLSVTGRAGRGERLEIAVGEDVLAGITKRDVHVLTIAEAGGRS